jgi:putative transposase
LSRAARLSLIDPGHDVPVARQCRLLGLPRSSVYYRPVDAALTDTLTRRIDVLYTSAPYLGYRKITAILRREGHGVNGKRVRRLMRRMGLEAVYCKPNTSRPHPENRVYPYLLKNVAITHPNQVWATDITYIRLTTGWAYLVAVMDWHSRYVLAWRLSGTMSVEFCVEALEEALGLATPDIFNTDQGSQFTSAAFTGALLAHEIKISMDGRGSYHDNIFTERLWRSVKYEEVYLKEYAGFKEAEAGIGAYIESYNTWRPHEALGYRTPADVHFALADGPPVDMMDNTALRSVLPTYPQAQQQQEGNPMTVRDKG